MYTSSDIASFLKIVIQEKNITIKQLLEDCKINKGFIYDLEHKKAFPSVDKVARIADYLDCSVDYLLGRTDNPNSHKLSEDTYG